MSAFSIIPQAVTRTKQTTRLTVANALIILLCFALRSQGDEDKTTLNMEGPQVTVSKTLKVVKRDNEDFLLYYFSVGKQRILFAYVGAAPDFPKEAPKDAKEEKIIIHDMTTRNYVWKDRKENLCRETLVKTGRNDFARYVHFVYTGLSSSDAKTADEIIASTQASAK